MIMQGTDGLSRGDFSAGVMAGQQMLQFVPLHLSAGERSPSLVPWVQSWAPVTPSLPLSPDDWFERGHGLCGGSADHTVIWLPHESNGTWFFWLPPPAIAACALQELGISRHKHPSLGHIFVCPHFFTQHWRKKLFNIADLVFEVAAGCRAFWSLTMHEPILVGLILPFSLSPPWQLRGSKCVLALVRELHQMWQDPFADERIVLHKLCACS
jgi:hypothetical protein